MAETIGLNAKTGEVTKRSQTPEEINSTEQAVLTEHASAVLAAKDNWRLEIGEIVQLKIDAICAPETVSSLNAMGTALAWKQSRYATELTKPLESQDLVGNPPLTVEEQFMAAGLEQMQAMSWGFRQTGEALLAEVVAMTDQAAYDLPDDWADDGVHPLWL